MASTPETSYSSSDGYCRASRTKAQCGPALSNLPSPQRSDLAFVSHEDEEYATEGVEDIQPVYRAIWDSFCGLPVQENPKFHLEQSSYELLYHKLSEHRGLLQYFEDKIRKDWNASTGRLTLNFMATRIHDIFKEKLVQVLTQELDRIGREPSLRPFRNKITSAGHSKIQKKGPLRAPVFDKSPDGQLIYRSALYPPFVFEIAYSQREVSLHNTVEEFFENAPGKICTVLAVEIEYAEEKDRLAEGHQHAASVSLWNTEPTEDGIDIHCLMDSRPFRDRDGSHLPGHVAMSFSSFLPIKERSKLPRAARDAEVRLDFAELSEFVRIAEEAQRISDKGISPSPSISPAAPRPKKLRWLDEGGNDTRETTMAEPKRRRIHSPGGLSVRSRTRSASRLRRSDLIRSMSLTAT